MSEARLRDDVVRFARSLFERGLTHGSSGNISVRLPDGGWLVTPTEMSLGFLDPTTLARLDAAGNLFSGNRPTKELPLHAALYETRPSAQAIVHLHSTHSVAVSMLDETPEHNALAPLTAYSVMKLGNVARLPYFRPGDPAVAGAIKALAGKHAAILLANHGPVVAAKSLSDAVFAAEEIEETAKLALLLRHVPHRVLSKEQIADLQRNFPPLASQYY